MTALDGTSNAIWEAETSSGSQVAGYSARGNVGVQTEGTYGRFKPDVVAPGTFVVSTRPTGSMWDQAAYYDPTNFDTSFSSYDLTVDTNTPAYGFANVPGNAVSVTIQVVPNNLSSTPFPTLPIYISATGIPDPNDNTTYDFVTSNNIISIPPDGGAGYLGTLLNGGFTCAVGAGTNLAAVNFDLIITLTTTNDNGNELTVLSNLNDTLGPYYRYETGTSMAAPAVSGALALLQDYFTNTLHSTPSPALLKAMVINGARLTSGYNFYGVTNSINYEGWGLVNVPNSVPLALTNAPGGTTPMYFLDQSPTNALATGDSRVFTVNVPTANAQAQLMHITLAWTDPPGNPAAGIKLVNNLDLVVTNNDSGEVFYGNNFVSGQIPHSVASTATNGVADNINNVESVILQAGLGTNYSVAVIGHNVAVNAVTTEQTNIVQDFALVISCGDGSNTNGITVTPVAPTPLVIAPNVTYVVATNGVYYNQIAGASAPWLSTNAIMFGTNSDYTTNDNLYIGQTNQWHFFVVTNNTPYTNAAFIIFLPETLATPREGVFADSTANSTRPEADLDLFVAGLPQGGSPGDPNAAGLTNLDPTIISNCVYNVNGDQASLARGGTKFIVYTNASLGQVFYVGVQCQDQMAADFGFLPIFSQNAFSQLDSNGNEVVTGLLLPATIPDGSNPHPGLYFSLGLATIPMTVGGLTVSNTIATQNYGDLIGVLTHDSAFSTLNNHTGPTDPGTYTTVYNDDGMTNTTHTDGPGSLRDFRGDQAIGPWFLSEIDDATSATGAITSFTVVIQPHLDLTKDLQQVTVQPYSWYYGYVDVPVGYTNISVVATNLTPPFSPAIQLYLNYNVEPDFTTYLAEADLTNGPAQNGNSISYGPPLQPGRYFVGLYNPSGLAHTVLLGVTLAFNASAITTLDVASTDTPLPLKDDAVTYDSITVTNTDVIQDFNVGLRVDHPRISDLVFHLISPDGTRYLLMENRGGQSTNGCGITVVATNVFSATANGTAQPNTNVINTGTTSGILPITYNFYTAPDQMTIYYGPTVSTNYLIYDTGKTNNPSLGSGAQNTQPITINVPYSPTNGLTSTYLTIVMDEFPANFTGGTNRSSFWTYTAGGVVTNFYYLAFTEDTNLTTTPIKFATPPFTPYYSASTTWTDSFEAYAPGTYTPASPTFGGWSVLTNQVEIATNLLAADGIKYLQLDNGAVVMNLPTIPGQKYLLTYQLGSKALGESNSVSTNANWTPIQVNFTATQASSPLVLDASGSGLEATLNSVVTSTFDTNALFDAFTLTQLPSDLYYQAEQDLSPLIGTSAKGTWTLEVLDNRAGATNNANLVSWNLGFTFANTNFTIPTLTLTNGNGPVTNFIPGGSIQWYLITVPTNADFATNSLLFATLPLNLWFSTNAPPTITNSPGDVLLFGNSTGNSVVLGTNGSPINLTSAYIIPGGSYYLGVQNTNSAGANYAVNVTFHYLPSTPLVFTLPATGVLDTSAILNAAVVPDGLNTTVYFEYGLDTNYGAFSASVVITNNLSSTNFVATGVTPLLAGAIYHFQAIGTNSLGTNYGGDLTFTNLADAPTVITEPATNILATTATLAAFVNPGGAATALYFEYGLATNSLTNFSTTLSLTSNLNATNFWGIGVTNLTPGSVYYFQAIAMNNAGTNYGVILTFTNPFAGPSPYAFTAPATLATGGSAQLNGFATPNGSPATAWFEWGASVGYGVTTPPVAIGTNYSVVFVTNQISGLTTNLPYHFRLVVSNAVSVTYGFDQIFDQGFVVAWGADFLGQTQPIPPVLTNLVSGIGAGYDFSLALNSNSTVVAWGDGIFGQTNVPPNLTNAVAVSGGYKVSLALRSDRSVIVWGSPQFKQTGTNVPANLTNAVAAVSGEWHCLALGADGTLVPWGNNSLGQTNVPASLTNVVSIAAGGYHNLALKNDSTVVAWGDDTYGQTDVPAGLSNVIAVAGGESHSVALLNNGTLVAWGDDSLGQVSLTPTGSNFIAIACGGFHSLALRNDGTVAQWGDSSAGQNPVFANTLTNVFAIAGAGGGGFHSLALTSLYGLNQTNNTPFWTNNPPTVTIFLLTNQTANVLLTNAATDTNEPAQILSYRLINNPPAWANLGQYTGILSLTPQEPQGLGTNYLTEVVTDNGYPALSATNIVTVLVYEINTPPFWPTNVPGQTNYTVIAGNLLTATNTASDLDLPTNVLTYALSVSGGITNALISTNGIITWTPSSVQAGNAYTFTTIVTDTNLYALTNQSLSATNTFTVTVALPNTAPFWPTNPPTLTLFELTNQPATTFVTNAATSTNFPVQTLTYALLTPPGWASINTNTGVITLSPVEPQGLGTNVITTVATGSSSPPLSATNTFNVLVYEINTPPYWPTNFPTQTNYVIGVSNLLTVTNTASDLDLPTNTLTYTNWVSPGVNPPAISTNGIITWTPQSAGNFVITNVVTDYNPWALTNQNLSATNYITVTVTNAPPPPTNAISIASIIATNGGFLLTWFAPSNDLFQVQFTASLAPANWLAFTNPAAVSYNTNFPASATNARFNFFDDGTQFPFGSMRFYRLLLLQNTNTLNFPAPSNQVASVSSLFTLTNTATESDTNAVLTYSLLSSPAGTSINPTNGIIIWTNATPAGLAARFTTVVTDNGSPQLTTNNTFTVFVSPFPSITNVTVTATNVALQWFAPTNDQFQVQWTTNLAPPSWTVFPDIITSSTGAFSFVDTNPAAAMKFYQLLLLP